MRALRSRAAPPRLQGWRLELNGEPDYQVDPGQHDPDLRAALALEDGLDLALVSLSSPLGIELLEPSQGAELLTAYEEGALALPAPFRAWAAASLTDVDPAALGRGLDRGFVGLQLPATGLLDDRGYARAAPLLAVLQERGRPLFVHPGPASRARSGSSDPAWWPAVVDYVQQMHAAWYAFRAFGRPRFPQLRVCFAMLAGLAPLHEERFATRSGERSRVDRQAYLEISSYGTRAVNAIAGVVGGGGLVNGSDRPYAKPVAADLGTAALSALRTANPARLLGSQQMTPALTPPASIAPVRGPGTAGPRRRLP